MVEPERAAGTRVVGCEELPWMTRADYRAWAERQPLGRFERIDGFVVAMAPERAAHNRRKRCACAALEHAVQMAGLPCEVYTDGMTVEVGDSDYEPDALVQCGAKLPDDAIAVPDPLIIVEVLSPDSITKDRVRKLRDYFQVPSLRHYLIVWSDRSLVTHHWRDSNGGVQMQSLQAGVIRLDPPGINISVEEIYADGFY